MGMTHTPRTLLEAVKFFKTHENCHDFMVSRRWPNGVFCPRCGSDSVYYTASAKRWECKTKHPQRTFTLKTGTIFEDSALGLDKWLPCVWIIANAKNGVSSHEIARSLGVTQKTAWFMLQRIRLALQSDGGGKFDGTIEADETYIGGKARNMHAAKRKRLNVRRGRSLTGKVAVMALLDRHGKDGVSQVRTEVLSNLKQRHVQNHVRKHVEAKSRLY